MPRHTATATATSRGEKIARHTVDARIFGGMMLSLGLAWMLREMGADLSWQTVLACGIASLGFGMMATPKAGHGLRLVLVGVVLTIILAGSSVEFSGWGIGDTVIRPATIEDLHYEYERALGDVTIDLGEVEFPQTTKFVSVKMGVGDLTVRVPDGVQVTLQAEVGMGDIRAFDRELADGAGINRYFETSGDPNRRLQIHLNLGLGDVNIERVRAGEIDLPGPPAAPALELEPPAAQARNT